MVISFVATQVGVDPAAYVQYDWQGRSIKEHRAQIREALGFRESSVADSKQMEHWLLEHVLPREHQEEHLREQAYQWYRRMRLEAPTPDRLTRSIRSAAHTFEQQLCETTYAHLPEEARTALEALLATETEEGEAEEEITLQHLRQDPGRVGLATMLQELAKLCRLRQLHLPLDLFAGIAYKVLQVYRNRASVEEPSRLRGTYDAQAPDVPFGIVYFAHPRDY